MTDGKASNPAELTGSAEPEAVRMTRLLTGFELSQALYALAKLDIATAMSSEPTPVTEIAARTGTHADSLRRMLRSLTAVGVIRQEPGEKFALTALGATLSGEAPDSVRDLAIMLMETHYAPFERFVETVRTGTPAASIHYGQPFMDWLTADTERAEAFSAAMASVTKGLQGDVFEGYTLPPGETVADIGGADGSVLLRLLRDEPRRHGIVFDLPRVVPAARTRIEGAELTDRVSVLAGDFFESVPAAEVYLLSTVLHDWNDQACHAILLRIAAAAQEGARLVVVEAVLPHGNEPHFAKSADLTMLGMLHGRERTRAEFAELFEHAGFQLDRLVEPPESGPYSILEASLRDS